MPHIKERLQSHSLQKYMLDVINSVIACLGKKDNHMANDEVSVDKSQNISVKPAKYHLCIVVL